VVNLLEDMKKKLEAEAEKDEDVDEKMKCWCKVRSSGVGWGQDVLVKGYPFAHLSLPCLPSVFEIYHRRRSRPRLSSLA
jgi:hypothetical protein